MKKKILITGANGFLGQHLCAYPGQDAYDVIACSRGKSRLPAHIHTTYESLELTDANAVQAFLNLHKPDVIIHNAAMSKPDECHANRIACMAANVHATQNLLRHSKAHFIYISSDFVFGENGPHHEEDVKDPLNYYGETKWQAEQLVVAAAAIYTIVRPVFIYGAVWPGLRPSFLHWVQSNLEAGKSIRVVSDQSRTPTYAPDICKGIQSIIDLQANGNFHLAGKDILSPYEMAVATARVLHLDEGLIENVTSATFPEVVIRARKSGLNIDKAIRELHYNPVSFEEGIRLTFNL